MFHSARPPVLALLAALTLAAAVFGPGCSEDAAGPDEENGADTTPPALSSVNPIDVMHTAIVFSEDVDRASAESKYNYEVRRVAITPAPALGPADFGDTLYCCTTLLEDDGRTVILSTSPGTEAGDTYRLTVQNIEDLHGNAMPATETMDFVGVDTPDTTPPEIVDLSPGPGATDVHTSQAIAVTFSEPMDRGSVYAAFYWNGPGSGVDFDGDDAADNIFLFSPREPLDLGETYTVGFDAGTATDWSGNFLSPSSWSFTTATVADTTSPILLSTTPADGAVNVPTDIVIEMEFSEAMDRHYQMEGGISMTPGPGDGAVVWTNGGTILTFDPIEPLIADTTYSLVIMEGAVRDVAGVPLFGHYQASFSTGSSLPTGAFSGRLAGEPGTAAADPEGALVIAFTVDPLAWDWDEDIPPIGGTSAADMNGDYEIDRLEDGEYWPIALMDTDGDREATFERDAVGIRGMTFRPMSGQPQSVVIAGGGAVGDVDFALTDMSAIWGLVSYGGTIYAASPDDYVCFVALFDTTGFDPDSAVPVLISEDLNVMWNNDFCFCTIDGLPDGTYYVGAYMDVDPGDGDWYNPLVDPAGIHEDGGGMIAITVAFGADFPDVDIVLHDVP